jgi:tetratricopeptide (TPR) repeat protein
MEHMSQTIVKASRPTSTKRAATAVERVQELFFSGQYAYAARLLERLDRSAPLEHWYGMTLLQLGRFHDAGRALGRSLALGHRGSIAPLAVLHRLTKQPRTWLLKLETSAFAVLDHFDRAMLEREVGIMQRGTGDLPEARAWFERAWRTALIGVHGRYQLPSLGQELGHTLGEMGLHAQAVSVLDEALKHCNAERRVPLLLERVTWGLYLGQLAQCASDLADIQTFIPRLPTNPGLNATVAYLAARLEHANGALNHALVGFEQAAELGLQAEHETEFYALLWALTTVIEMGRLESIPPKNPKNQSDVVNKTLYGAEVYHIRAEDTAVTKRQEAWLSLRTALLHSRSGEVSQAFTRAEVAMKTFQQLGALWEVGAVGLTQAEIALAIGSEYEAQILLREALTVARAIGGTGPYTTELRALPLVTAFLNTVNADSEFTEWNTATSDYRCLKVYTDHLKLNGERVQARRSSAGLLRYMLQHPCSTWAHLHRAVYPAFEHYHARLEFRADRRELAKLGVMLEREVSSEAYSAVWEGFTVEIAPEAARLPELN